MQGRMGDWKQIGENLVRHRGGTIYLRAKVGGKIVRVSLETEDLRIAKIKRDSKLEKLREVARKDPQAAGRTLGDLLAGVGDQLAQPHLKDDTRRYYVAMIGILKSTLPTDLAAKEWGPNDARLWWKKVVEKYAPQRANNALRVARMLGAAIVARGLQMDDPTEKLRRVPIRKKKLVVPSRGLVESIIAEIAGQRKRDSTQSARYVGFLAYSGMRHGEAHSAMGEDAHGEWFEIHGGDKGTKNHESRRLPINAPLRAILDELPKQGPLFTIRTPRIALANACERLGVPHLRLHDLRHFFATWSIECEVDVPTVAKWLGHKDGGVLAMRTYGHLRDAHSLESAKKLK